MKFTLRQVEVFLAVAECLHFGRAAEKLHISQPTVSQEVARLERSVGLALLDRSRRTVTLTPAGTVMASEGRLLLDQAGSLIGKVLLHEESRMNTARLVASPSIVNRLLPAVLSQAEIDLPTLKIEDMAVETGAVSSALAAELADIGLGRFLDDMPGFKKETIADEPVFVAVSRDHPAARPPGIALRDLADVPLLLWPREQHPRYYDFVLAMCADRGLEPHVIVSPPRIVGSRLYLLSQGRAFSLVPGSTTGHLSGDVVAVPLQEPAALPLEMQWRADDRRTPLLTLRELVRGKAAELEDR
ncbi:LysR family transcriptional regulator [Microtetraspora sp. AC03309]|uniref:LysR family transcriptional regulator n=1 Tax=Microtetraspora sp. AC03309 TaxID=2779376 RepID=UPI001E3B16B3|nr:LysR substrate-binding domain-containing protein [Microtetraspora sp. AC03309]MCC5575311.1 LysR family transcriptional regulator [Microtetraspora sp. AC03309]